MSAERQQPHLRVGTRFLCVLVHKLSRFRSWQGWATRRRHSGSILSGTPSAIRSVSLALPAKHSNLR